MLLHSPLHLSIMSPPRSISSSGSRSSNRMSNPNVFDDENELESLETPGNSPFDADDDTTPTSASPLVHNAAPNITSLNNPNPTASTPQQRCSASRKSSGVRDAVSSTPNRSTSRASNTFSDIHRASSTSSRFSMPRSQSPYVGATGPSHPYGMYPQITRASSTASASTVRPVERPFMAPSGPEHPYAMYSQNTVPEEDDVSLAQANIPLGFPGMAQQYQRENETRREDIADIVGSDGHVEELPPYTRYANEAAPKESPPSARAMPVPTATPAEIPLSLPSQPTQHADHVVELNTTASRNAESASSGSFKEKIKRKGKKRLCCGLPFCVIIGVLLLGVIIGAIIGGVVGSGKVASSSGTAESQNSSYVLVLPFLEHR